LNAKRRIRDGGEKNSQKEKKLARGRPTLVKGAREKSKQLRREESGLESQNDRLQPYANPDPYFHAWQERLNPDRPQKKVITIASPFGNVCGKPKRGLSLEISAEGRGSLLREESNRAPKKKKKRSISWWGETGEPFRYLKEKKERADIALKNSARVIPEVERPNKDDFEATVRRRKKPSRKGNAPIEEAVSLKKPLIF